MFTCKILLNILENISQEGVENIGEDFTMIMETETT